MLNVAEVDRMVTYLERLLTINWQNTLFTWFCEVSTRVSMTTKPGRMVTYFEILLTIKSFYALITWLCTVFLKDQHSETKKQYRTVSYYWKFAPHSKLSRSFQWLECFIDETEAMTRSSVSTSLSSIHSNSWNWKHTVVVFVAELQLVVVLGVEVELFWQIAYLVVQKKYQMELSSDFYVPIHANTLL